MEFTATATVFLVYIPQHGSCCMLKAGVRAVLHVIECWCRRLVAAAFVCMAAYLQQQATTASLQHGGEQPCRHRVVQIVAQQHCLHYLIRVL